MAVIHFYRNELILLAKSDRLCSERQEWRDGCIAWAMPIYPVDNADNVDGGCRGDMLHVGTCKPDVARLTQSHRPGTLGDCAFDTSPDGVELLEFLGVLSLTRLL
jgi:hypothetical protein